MDWSVSRVSGFHRRERSPPLILVAGPTFSAVFPGLVWFLPPTDTSRALMVADCGSSPGFAPQRSDDSTVLFIPGV